MSNHNNRVTTRENTRAQRESADPALALTPRNEATHRAVRDGAWNNPRTWGNGKVPGNGAKVFIPQGRTVTYNRKSRNSLDWVRVDGDLKFSNNRDTELILDTLNIAPSGHLEIGTEDVPIRDQNSARIRFTARGALNSNQDPTLLGRGLVSKGSVTIHGADKLDHVALQGDLSRGDRELVLDLPPNAGRPRGWQVGDKLVLGGTQFNRRGNNRNNSKYQDEVLTITSIRGNRIRFTNDDLDPPNNTRLRFDHRRPGSIRSQVDLYVANISRNVSLETLNGKEVPTQQRAHAIFEDNPNVNIQNAGFYELGRTDKSIPIDDIGTNRDGSPGKGTNPRGRYSLHIHRTGFDVNDGTVTLEGNAVVGSPGWGIVQHASKALVRDNVVFDVTGAGIVSEDGNESGWWINNITIKTTGDGRFSSNPARPERLDNYDLGTEGEGYWLTGAGQIAMRGNIAISAAGGGINVFSTAFGLDGVRPINSIPRRILPEDLRAISPNSARVPLENVPLRFFNGFEAYNSNNGILFWQHLGNNDGQLTFNAPNLDPAHDVRTRVSNFKLWGILDRGVEYQYSTQIDLENGLIAGSPNQAVFGIRTNGPSQDLRFRNLQVEGFRQGLTVPRAGRLGENNPTGASVLENSRFRNNEVNLSDRLSYQNPNTGAETFPDYFQIRNTRFDNTGPNQAPRSQEFRSAPVGGLTYQFDASDAFDPDVQASRQNSAEGIAAYGWDFNSDGRIDDYGRIVQRRFSRGGRRDVTLTVWDAQGETSRNRQSVNIRRAPYRNPFLDSTFDRGTRLVSDSTFQSSAGAGFGWLTSGWRVNPNLGQGGALEVQNTRRGAAQVIYDNGARIGRQDLTIDVRSVNRDNTNGEAIVRLWGVNGEFQAQGWRIVDNGPEQEGTLPFRKDLLLRETVTPRSRAFETSRWSVNLGNRGYDYLIVQVNADNVDLGRGEQLFIDNVGLTSPGQPIASPRSTVDLEVPGSTFARQSASGNGSGYRSSLAALAAEPEPIRDLPTVETSEPASDDNLRLASTRRTYHVGRGSSDILVGDGNGDIIRGQGESDALNGGNGNDILVGGRGADVISTGLGRDRVRFFQVSHGGDRITDFNSQQDVIEIHGANFGGGLQSGALAATQFTLGTRATDSDDRLVYHSGTGQLFFDRDGVGSSRPVLLARLEGKPSLTAANVRVL